jgi:putative transposase
VRKSRFTEQQISYALHQAESATPVAEVIRKMAVTDQTFCKADDLMGHRLW